MVNRFAGPGTRMIFQDVKGGEKPGFLSPEEAKQVRRFHGTMEGYRPTPLGRLPALAERLGVGDIFVKDESCRFGLNAFKALGGVYAVARLLGRLLGLPPEELDFSSLKSQRVKKKIGDLTLITATDGNHGRAVAWAAEQLGQQAVVYLPRGSAEIRVRAIRETGARAYVTEVNYDETVLLALKRAREEGWHMVQDTAWEGYTDIPCWIMQGYMTMASEALDQMAEAGVSRPTHLFLQAGVGAMAGAVLGYLVHRFPGQVPVTALVEPTRAACFLESAAAGDGRARDVGGDLKTSMAGLSCGVPNPLAWPILRDHCRAFAACDDFVTARGMRILGNPLGNDPRAVSGESGAVGLGLLSLLREREELAPAAAELGLDGNSRVLLFSTEGDTDPENYRRIVWDGQEPSPD